ncbi:MAG: hypothetical protein ACLR06_00770 [Christensenellaceae bacterium]
MKTAAAVVACLLTGTCVFLMHASAFAGGKSTYYLYSASSQAEIKESLKPAELVGLKGESAVYVFENGRRARTRRLSKGYWTNTARRFVLSKRPRVRFPIIVIRRG